MIRFLWLLAWLLLDTDSGGDDADDSKDDADDKPDADDEPTRDPEKRITALEEQKARLIKKLDQKDARIKELEDAAPNNGDLRSARLELAFMKSAITTDPPPSDLNTAWDLLNVRGFLDALPDDGEGMDEAVSKLLGRYPWLSDEPPEDDGGDMEPPPGPSGRRTNEKKNAAGTPDTSALAKRFPALRGRRKVV